MCLIWIILENSPMWLELLFHGINEFMTALILLKSDIYMQNHLKVATPFLQLEGNKTAYS